MFKIGSSRFRYQLKDEEVAVLKGDSKQGSKANITPEFFQALDKARAIHVNCKELLKTGHQPTALEIMEQMSMFVETGLERLYRWAQSQCRTIETSENTTLVSQAMKHLQERPIMFKYVMDEYCSARKSLLVRAFIDALTVGGPQGTPKPIELHAHDPPRYVGDMLAWLHQAIPGENENIRALLKVCWQYYIKKYTNSFKMLFFVHSRVIQWMLDSKARMPLPSLLRMFVGL